MQHSKEQIYWDEFTRNNEAYIFYDLMEYQHILNLMGNEILCEKKVLEIGCGKGIWTANLARIGAKVFHFDLTRFIVATAKEAATPFTTYAFVADMHFLPIANNSVDFVFGSMVLHHASNHDFFGHEVARVLKSGGRAIFHENSDRNPILRFARNSLVGRLGIPKYSSSDEHPLRLEEIQSFGSSFTSYRSDYLRMVVFQLAVKYLLRREDGLIYQFARNLDRFIYKNFPRWRYLSYYQVVHFDKESVTVND